MSILGKCVIITISILLVEGFPAREETKWISTDENCLKINAEIQKQIDSIIEQITNNINIISANYDDIDLRLLEISMDRHYSEEGEKNTVVQIKINDCTKGVSQIKYNGDQKHKNSPIAQGKDKNEVELQKYDENVKYDDLEDDDDDIFNDLKSEEIIANEKSDEPSNEFPEENNINEDDLFIDDVINNNNVTPKYKNDDEKLFDEFNGDSNINKDNIPDVLEFINYNDIKTALFNDEIHNDSNESLILNDNDKIFFRALTKARGTGPFVVYQRRYDDAEEYWFF